jgi:predicted nucleotidyltransferase
MSSYYRAVVRSYVSTLRRAEGIRALYAYGSFVGGNFRPGRSDVDFVAVTDAPTAAREVELLLRLRGSYRRHQGFLPIDVWEIPAGELADTGGWIGGMRPRAGETRPRRSVGDWQLITGEELRPDDIWEADWRLATIGDYFIRNAISRAAPGRVSGLRLASHLEELERDVTREGFAWPSLADLGRARARLARGSSSPADVEAALHATLRVVEDHRRHHAFPYEGRLTPGGSWRVPSPEAAAVAGGRKLLGTLDREAEAALRSAVIYLPFDGGRPTVVLECEDARSAPPIIAWIVRGGGIEGARRAGLQLHLLTSWLAEDLWRSGRHCYALAGGGRSLVGEDLTGRIRVPARRWRLDLAHYEGFWGAASVRWRLLGHRRTVRRHGWPLELAAERRLAAEEPPLLDWRELMREEPELRALGADDPGALAALDDAAWARVALEIWRGWPPVRERREPT